MKKYLITLAILALTCACSKQEQKANVFVTTADKTKTMTKDSALIVDQTKLKNSANLIVLQPQTRYQQMDGFGVAITGSSAHNLLKMTPQDRQAILKETFDPITGYGFSYIRVSIGASDFSMDEYSYCDKPGIENFAINHYDKTELIPILKQIKAINPKVKILGSPWTPPRWMKVNNLKQKKPFNSWNDGQLNPKYYMDYATYFVKYIQAMAQKGITIDAVTIQNEPLNRGNSSSMYMTWQEQRDFIKTALGPAFHKAGIKTKIIVFDHNFDYDASKAENKDQIHYPLKIYADKEASQYIDGGAYHAYGGSNKELAYIHAQRPDKNLYFTEMSIGQWDGGYNFGGDLMWNMREVCIGTINNFTKAIIMWNYMLDDKHGPYRPGGCDQCLGAIDINSSDYKTMTKNSHYYEMAHLAKVIQPGAYRIGSQASHLDKSIYYSTFINPDGKYSVVLLNDSKNPKDIHIRLANKDINYHVLGQSVNSFIWN